VTSARRGGPPGANRSAGSAALPSLPAAGHPVGDQAPVGAAQQHPLADRDVAEHREHPEPGRGRVDVPDQDRRARRGTGERAGRPPTDGGGRSGTARAPSGPVAVGTTGRRRRGPAARSRRDGSRRGIRSVGRAGTRAAGPAPHRRGAWPHADAGDAARPPAPPPSVPGGWPDGQQRRARAGDAAAPCPTRRAAGAGGGRPPHGANGGVRCVMHPTPRSLHQHGPGLRTATPQADGDASSTAPSPTSAAGSTGGLRGLAARAGVHRRSACRRPRPRARREGQRPARRGGPAHPGRRPWPRPRRPATTAPRSPRPALLDEVADRPQPRLVERLAAAACRSFSTPWICAPTSSVSVRPCAVASVRICSSSARPSEVTRPARVAGRPWCPSRTPTRRARPGRAPPGGPARPGPPTARTPPTVSTLPPVPVLGAAARGGRTCGPGRRGRGGRLTRAAGRPPAGHDGQRRARASRVGCTLTNPPTGDGRTTHRGPSVTAVTPTRGRS
jgi:hypothetical protein